MSDSKDPKEKSSPAATGIPDMESTVRLDFGNNQNIFSTSDSDEISSTDFEQTLDGLMDIDDMLQSEEPVDHSSDEPTISFATDEVDFDELDAGINALADELPDEKKLENENLDDFADISDITDDDDLFSFDESAGEDATESTVSAAEDEAPASTTSDSDFDEWPLIDETRNNKRSEEGSAESVTNDATDADPSTEVGNEDEPPVIELTEAMLDESESQPEQEAESEQPEKSLDSVIETPGLTTTETNILADATAAIKEIGEEEQKSHMEDHMHEPVGQTPLSSAPVRQPQGGGSSAMPTMLALLGMAAGGFGAWMAWDASNRVASLESEIRNLQAAKANSADKQSIADMQQRLTKVERRLTGTPTIEAATLGASDSSVEDETTQKTAMTDKQQTKPVAKAITPKTAMTTAAPKGSWVINISSHVNAKAANQERARLSKLGLNAEVHSATIKNKVWYRVQIVGFATKDEAKAQLREVEQRSGIKDVWIGKR